MIRKRLILFFLFLSFFFLLPRVALAQEPAKNILVEKGEIINHDFFAGGESVTISGVVNGDVYAAGANVSVDGIINGDLIAGAGMITLLGEVSDDVRVAGGNVLINGLIGKNLTVGGGSVLITNEADIKGSVLVFGGNVEVKGPIGREANVFAGKALFSHQIGGDLKGAFEELILTSEAQVMGNLEYESKNEAEIDAGALVFGETIHKLPKEGETKFGKLTPLRPVLLGFSVFRLYLKIFSLVIVFLVGLLFLSLFHKRTKSILDILKTRPWASLGFGILTPILFGLAMFLLAITLVGIPLVLVIAPLFGLLVYLSRIFLSLHLGAKVLHRLNLAKGQPWALFTGLLIYFLLSLIPVIGGITAFIFTTLGLGAFVLDQKALHRK